jgi:hypothetical protein
MMRSYVIHTMVIMVCPQYNGSSLPGHPWRRCRGAASSRGAELGEVSEPPGGARQRCQRLRAVSVGVTKTIPGVAGEWGIVFFPIKTSIYDWDFAWLC